MTFRGTLTRLFAPATAVLSIGCSPLPVYAQYFPPTYVSRTDGRLAIEGFFSHHRLHPGLGAERTKLPGVGARIMWSLAPRFDPEHDGLAARAAVGAFAVNASDRTDRVKARHYGAQLDISVLRTPVAGRIEPLLSVGAGAFRV